MMNLLIYVVLNICFKIVMRQRGKKGKKRKKIVIEALEIPEDFNRAMTQNIFTVFDFFSILCLVFYKTSLLKDEKIFVSITDNNDVRKMY